MIDLLRSHRAKIPYLGDMLFSILTFPVVFTFMQKWIAEQRDADTVIWLCAMYVTLGLVHLFRAFRLRKRSRSAFIAHLVYCAFLALSGAVLAAIGIPETGFIWYAMPFWVCMLSERVLDIVRNRRVWRILFNLVAILLILSFAFGVTDMFALISVGLTASFASLLTIMVLIFSQIRLDILKEIVRKTYAIEIIFGLLVMMVSFSNVLIYVDTSFESFWDALWYCFAIVTTIGFGDITATTGIGRLLSVILGLYGIIVVSLITSIIVNFYSEVKSDGDAEDADALKAAPDTEKETQETEES